MLFGLLTKWQHGGAESFLRNQISSVNREILSLLCYLKVQYRVPKSPQFVPLDTDHVFLSCSLDIYFNIILSSAPKSPNWPVSFRFPYQNAVWISVLLLCNTCPVSRMFLGLITTKIFWGSTFIYYRVIKVCLVSFSALGTDTFSNRIWDIFSLCL